MSVEQLPTTGVNQHEDWPGAEPPAIFVISEDEVVVYLEGAWQQAVSERAAAGTDDTRKNCALRIAVLGSLMIGESPETTLAEQGYLLDTRQLPQLIATVLNQTIEHERGDETEDMPAEWDGEDLDALLADSKEITLNSDAFRQYRRNIDKHTLLTAVQEVELAKEIEAGQLAAERLQQAKDGKVELSSTLKRDLQAVVQGGERAMHEFTEGNLRLVLSIARPYFRRSVQPLDLVQEGNLGLIDAIKQFDYTKGVKFSTFAFLPIRKAVLRGLNMERTIRLPTTVTDDLSKLGTAARELALGREPTIDELAKAADLSPKRVEELQKYKKGPRYLDAPIDDDEGSAFGEFIEDAHAPTAPKAAAFSEMYDELDRLFSSLGERTADMLRRRFGFVDGVEWTYEKIGQRHNVTGVAVRRQIDRILSRLRHKSQFKTETLYELFD